MASINVLNKQPHTTLPTPIPWGRQKLSVLTFKQNKNDSF